MKTFKQTAAQGEVRITRIGDVPKGGAKSLTGKAFNTEGGRYILGHSETGHHHVLEHTRGVKIVHAERSTEGMTILRAILEEPNSIQHLREHDTHETIALAPGEYEFTTDREYDPWTELSRRAMD